MPEKKKPARWLDQIVWVSLRPRQTIQAEAERSQIETAWRSIWSETDEMNQPAQNQKHLKKRDSILLSLSLSHPPFLPPSLSPTPLPPSHPFLSGYSFNVWFNLDISLHSPVTFKGLATTSCYWEVKEYLRRTNSWGNPWASFCFESLACDRNRCSFHTTSLSLLIIKCLALKYIFTNNLWS